MKEHPLLGGQPEDIIQLTVYVTSVAEYRAAAAELATVWRDRMGRFYPTMALVGVTELVEPGAKVEIAGLAVLPQGEA